MTFLLPSSSWLLKFSIHASSRGLEGRLFSMSRASIITAVGSNEIGNRIKSDQVGFVRERESLVFGMKRRSSQVHLLCTYFQFERKVSIRSGSFPLKC